MDKYENKVIRLRFENKESEYEDRKIEKELNIQGQKGWTLACTPERNFFSMPMPMTPISNAILYLKRKIH